MSKLLMGAFENPAQADRAIRELEEAGYTTKDISVISQHDKYKEEGHDTGEEVTKAAGTGAATGGVIGGLAGFLAGVGVIPAVAGLFIGGPVAAALGLTGAAAATASGAMTGAAAGGLVGALTGLGMSKETAASYDDVVNRGGVVVGVNTRMDDLEEARDILADSGARNIDTIDTKHDRTSEDDIVEDVATDTRATQRQQPAFGERLETPRDVRDSSLRDE